MTRPTLILVMALASSLAGCLRTSVPPEAPLAQTELRLRENYRVLDTATGLAYSGYRVERPRYQAELACNRYWGYYSLEVFLRGEPLAYTRNIEITDDGGVVFTPQQDYRTNRKGFLIDRRATAVHWRIDSDTDELAGYRGGLRFELNRVELAAEWTPRAGLAVRVVPACLRLGRPLVNACPYRAVLADGTVVADTLPTELPPAGTVLVGGTESGGIREITLYTRKGAATMRFLSDGQAEQASAGLPPLVAGVARNGQGAERAWELPVNLPAGPVGQPQTYRIVFEFEEQRTTHHGSQ